MSRLSVAVLGGGIMGSSVALRLARLGARATLFEREAAPFRGASRWNEGKIHLGFLYAGDPSLATARSVLDGGLGFAGQVKALTGVTCAERMTAGEDLYLVHRDSVASPTEVRDYFGRLAGLIRAHPRAADYLADVSRCPVRELSAAELEAVADPGAVAAALAAPERSVDTNFVADAFVGALDEAPAVELACGAEVTGAERDGDRWAILAGDDRHGPFDAVVNALWEGRPAVDRAVGHRPDQAHQHRYRVSLFVRTERALDVPSGVVAVGPFGDVKNYGGRDFYVSWYPAGLLARGESVEAPAVPELAPTDRERVAAETFAGIGGIVPAALEIQRAAREVRVEGGWVYSQGRGLLDDPGAGVHRRDRHGISSRGTWFSVDTGKYSVAPTLAESVARLVLARTPQG